MLNSSAVLNGKLSYVVWENVLIDTILPSHGVQSLLQEAIMHDSDMENKLSSKFWNEKLSGHIAA